MGKVMNIELNTSHVVSELICINCKHRFIDTRPINLLLKDLECPKCKQVGYLIETGQILE